MEPEQLKPILEALLFAAGEPVSLARLGNALESVAREAIKQALAELAAEYANSARGIMLEEVAGGYQLRTRKEYAAAVRRLLSSRPPRLSRPLLETLAIIAYRPQVTRAEIEQLRGVDTGGVLETLLERELVRIAGRRESPGRPLIYETTSTFLELFGLKDLQSLPDLEEFRALEGALAEAADTAAAEPVETSAIDTAPEGVAETAEPGSQITATRPGASDPER